ncbi:MAG: SNF2 helicase associated domain-containing protein, partial [Ignavibacteriales bacterium]|nr:SNF2 helicase associated domain-containing protein [Ignavibacteriales bacterium]
VFKENGFELYGEADLKKYKVNLSKPKVAYSVSSGVDWFDLQAKVDFDGIAVDFSSLIASIKAKKKYLELSDGSIGIIPEEWVNKFKQTISLGDVQDNSIRFSRVQASALDAFL